ncbi:MAG: hypothetical protein GY847_17670 [Proteobacteria bacterium]|nr:hypothetical protein [Pseudomonadota bacterium]
MPIIYDGSYIDEYLHIFSGTSFLQEGRFARFYSNHSAYLRGSYVSVIVAAFLSIFGKSLFVAKLVPILLGTINYFLFFHISNKAISDKKLTLLLLAIYTLSPWVIFNHFYIRFYVFYEFFLLLLLVLSHGLLAAINKNKWRSFFLYLLAIFSLNLFNLVLSNDNGKHLLSLSTALLLAFVFIFEIDKMRLSIQGPIGKTLTRFLGLNRYAKSIFLAAFAVFIFFFLNLDSKLEYLRGGTLAYPGSEDRYTSFFVHRNTLFFIFFICAPALFYILKTSYHKVIVIIGITLFSLHIFSSSDLRIMRGILYFIPLFYLVSCITIDNLKFFSYWPTFFIISTLLVATTLTGFTDKFLQGPNLPREIHYIDYQALYSTVKSRCASDEIIVDASPSAYISQFYNVNLDYVMVATKHKKSNNYYFDSKTKKYYTVLGDVPVLESFKALKRLKRNVCLIVRSPSKRRFVPRSKYVALKKRFHLASYQNLELLYLPYQK